MNEIRLLTRVQWASPGKRSELLTHHGLRHHFGGLGDLPPENHLPSKQQHGVAILEVLSDFQYKMEGTNQQPVRIERPKGSGLNPVAEVDDRPIADGQVTSTPGQVIVVKTADCLPILIADSNHTLVGAVHAGWRGLTSGILKEALNCFFRRGVSSKKILVAIGPAISRENYEVGDDVVQAVLSAQFGLGPTAAALSLAKGRGDRWHFDLCVAAALHLCALGVEPNHIEVIKACTMGDTQWNSYRRDRHRNQLNWSSISLPYS